MALTSFAGQISDLTTARQNNHEPSWRVKFLPDLKPCSKSYYWIGFVGHLNLDLCYRSYSLYKSWPLTYLLYIAIIVNLSLVLFEEPAVPNLALHYSVSMFNITAYPLLTITFLLHLSIGGYQNGLVGGIRQCMFKGHYILVC